MFLCGVIEFFYKKSPSGVPDRLENVHYNQPYVFPKAWISEYSEAADPEAVQLVQREGRERS
jgi:hypothetical protein